MSEHIKTRSSVEKAPLVVEYLKKVKSASPRQIAININSDIRTLQKILKSLLKLNLIEIKTIKLAGKVYSEVKLKKR